MTPLDYMYVWKLEKDVLLQ